MVYGICRMLLRDPNEAEDATQQVFLFRRTATCSPGPWCATRPRGSARSPVTLAGAVRRPGCAEPLALVDDDPTQISPSVEDTAVGREEAAALYAELAVLPEKQREADACSRDIYGLRYDEVATALGTSRPAVEDAALPRQAPPATAPPARPRGGCARRAARGAGVDRLRSARLRKHGGHAGSRSSRRYPSDRETRGRGRRRGHRGLRGDHRRARSARPSASPGRKRRSNNGHGHRREGRPSRGPNREHSNADTDGATARPGRGFRCRSRHERGGRR